MDFKEYCSIRDYENNAENQKKYDVYLANKKRQKDYRYKHRLDKRRINMLVSESLKLSFDLLANHYGVTKIELLDKLVKQNENSLLSKMSEKEMDMYYSVTP